MGVGAVAVTGMRTQTGAEMGLSDTLVEFLDALKDPFRWVQSMPKDPKKEIENTIATLQKLTLDEDPVDIQLRALKVYLAIVQHSKAGGVVKFLGRPPDRTLKIRRR